MQETGSAVKRALDFVRAQQSRGVVLRTMADDMEVAESTLSRWLSGDREPTGEKRGRLLSWYERESPLPVSADAQYWRGVLYACEAMAETTHRLLREAREADATALRARAVDLIPPVPTADLPASETRPPRRRQGKG